MTDSTPTPLPAVLHGPWQDPGEYARRWPADPMPYVRDSYVMQRVEIVAPGVRNDGAPSGYAERVRGVLIDNGLGGWTEFHTVGAWQGVREPGTTFVLYLPNGHAETIVRELADELRAAMPDQDAIQAVVFPATVTLYEL